MSKGSSSRGARRAQNVQAQSRAAGPRVSTAALIHPMFQSKINELGLEQKKKDMVPCWDELNKMYVLGFKAISTPAIVGMFARRKDVLVHLTSTDHEQVHTRLGMLKRDITLLKNELSEIYKSHEGKEGLEGDPDQIMEAAMIGEKYNILLTKAEAMLAPNTESIAAIFASAEMRMKAVQQARAEDGTSEVDVPEGEIKNVVGQTESLVTKVAEQDARLLELEREQPQQPV